MTSDNYIYIFIGLILLCVITIILYIIFNNKKPSVIPCNENDCKCPIDYKIIGDKPNCGCGKFGPNNLPLQSTKCINY